MKTAHHRSDSVSNLKPYCSWLAVALVIGLPLLVARAQGFLTIANPSWNITLSDYGYSDFLLDNTPGFEGREYLSGEWGAAIAYQVSGSAAVSPQWLEPNFAYPDWPTHSPFHVVSPLALTGVNGDGLPIAQSVIANDAVEITLRYEMVDAVVGTPMGTVAASSGGAGAYVDSERYVLLQNMTIKNISGSAISDLRFYQFLHGLQSQRGVFDNRTYAGPLSDRAYDVTLSGVDMFAVGAGSSTSGLEDFIGFHSSVVPTAYEIGYYGIEGNGVDFHSLGKPSEGVHLSVGDDWKTAPYSTRQGTDSFAPLTHWLAGAQRWSLGGLSPGQSVSHEVVLSLRTATKVDTGTTVSGGCNGGKSAPGGMEYEFEDVIEPGSCFVDFAQADEAELEIRVTHGNFGPLTFLTPGNPVQIWEVSFSGVFNGNVALTFAYNPQLLPIGFDESTLCLYRYSGSVWQQQVGTVDTLNHTITVSVTTLSAFALGVDPGSSYAVSTSVAPVGGGTITGSGPYAQGAGVSLAATASSGYAFVNWTEGAVVVSTSPSYSFTAMGNRTLVANFVAAGGDYAVSTTSLPVNGGTTGGDGAYTTGASATVTATAADGYKFSKWLVNDVVVSTASSYTFTVGEDTTLVAKFKPVFKILVSSDPPGGGELEVDPFYELGELAKLKGNPNDNYAFMNWTENGVVVSTETLYTFNVGGGRELVGHFALGNRIDTGVSPNHAGTTSGGGVHAQGAPVTVAAVANQGYVFLNWTEGGSIVGESLSYGLTSDTSHTLVANFIAQPALRLLPGTTGALVLGWPENANGWQLIEKTNLNTGSWVPSTLPVDVTNGEKRVSVETSANRAFFRLKYP